MKTIILLAVLATSIYGCAKYELPGNVPECLQENLESFCKTSTSDANIHLDVYDFQSTTAYALVEENNWNTYHAIIYDNNCNIIEEVEWSCFYSDNDDIHFFENATYLTTIWDRK